jgi:integrase
VSGGGGLIQRSLEGALLRRFCLRRYCHHTTTDLVDSAHSVLPLPRILVFTCAATTLWASELIALCWVDLRFDERRIRICKHWSRGKEGATKTAHSVGFVPLHPCLVRHMHAWRARTPFGKDKDFVFSSFKASGKVPLSACIFAADQLRRQPSKLVCGSPMAIVLASITFGTRIPTGW